MMVARSAIGQERVGQRSAGVRGLAALPSLSPLLFGIPVLLGIAVMVSHLVSRSCPYLAATTTNTDAEVLYLGHTIYQNPAHGYTGMVYTPLYVAVVALLDHVHLWAGWSSPVTIGACFSLQGLAVWLAYDPAGKTARLVRALGALGDD